MSSNIGLPLCLWSMKNLISLFVSNNGLRGKLPENNISSTLRYVSAAYNKLGGTLSTAVQSHYFIQLDLSYNKIAGTVLAVPTTLNALMISIPDSDQVNHTFDSFLAVPIKPNVSLIYSRNISELYLRHFSLQVNRLSGYLPPANWSTIDFLSVLYGNLIGCRSSQDLPSRDSYFEDSGSYDCGGSMIMNNALIVFGTICIGVAIFAIISITLLCTDFAELDVIQLMKSTTHKMIFYNDLLDARSSLDNISKVCLFFCSLQNLLKLSCSVGVFSLVCCTGLYLGLKLNDVELQYSTHSYEYSWLFSAAYFSGLGPAVGLFCIFMSIVVYCSLVTSNINGSSGLIESDRKKRFLQCAGMLASVSLCIAISAAAYAGYVSGVIFDSNFSLLFQIILSVFNLLWKTSLVPRIIRYFISINDKSERQFTMLQVLIQCTCAVIVPLVVVVCLDPSCFRSIVIPPEDLNYFYFVYKCEFYGVKRCLVSTLFPVNSTLSPVFHYNNQCYSSAIIYNTTPVLYSSALTILLSFIFLMLLSCDISFEKVPWFLRKLVPSIIWPYHTDEFPVSTIAATLMSNFAVMITFGVASPSLIGTALEIVIAKHY